MRKEDKEKTVKNVVTHMIETRGTVRKTGKDLNISKSCVFKYCTVDIKELSLSLYEEVSLILAQNKLERAKRGGEATRKKYARLKH